jgi:hypothetical protein
VPPARPTITVYVVQRLDWAFNDQFFFPAGGMELRAFRDPDRAEAYRLELEAATRRGEMECELANPFTALGNGLDDQSSLDGEQFRDTLRSHGIDPPFEHDFENWWEDEGKSLSPEQRRIVWDLCDQVKLYEVVECEIEVAG